MPIFRQQVAGGTSPIAFANRAFNYVLVGLYADDGSVSGSHVVEIGQSGLSQVSEMPHDITLDRCYFKATHLTSGATVVPRSFGANLIITDSYLYAHNGVGYEIQAFGAYNFDGPLLIDNCMLAAPSENILIGGAGTAASLVPHDLTFRRCHFWKDPTWVSTVKNNFELKKGVRVLLEDSVLENFWPQGQQHMLNLKSVNQTQTANENTSETSNVVIRNTKWIGAGGGGVWKVTPGTANAIPCNNISFVNNLCVDIGDPTLSAKTGGGTPNYTIAALDVPGLYFANNTFMGADGVSLSGGCLTPGVGANDVNFKFYDNIMQRRAFGVKAAGTTEGTTSFNAGWISPDVRGNLFISASSGLYPANNSFPATIAAVGFTNSATKDYTLSAGSAYLAAGKDGGVPGCDIATLNAKIAGAITGVWS